MTDNARIQLAKKAIDRITEESFIYYVGASTGGKCNDGWCTDMYLYLSREEMMYLIYTGETEFLFEGLKLTPVDVEERMNEDLMEAAWPDGGPTAYVNNIIPEELCELESEINSIDVTNQVSVDALRDKLKQIPSGNYTFSFTIDADGYLFDDEAEEQIELSNQEAINLLYASTLENKIIFEGLCETQLSQEEAESIINEKASEKDFADNYDNFCYSTEECESLDNCINAWNYVLLHILSGDIKENTFESWMEYFKESYNYDQCITDWYEDKFGYIDDEEEDDEDAKCD